MIIITIMMMMMMMMMVIRTIIIKVRIGSDLTPFSTDFIHKVSQVRKGSPLQDLMKCTQPYLT